MWIDCMSDEIDFDKNPIYWQVSEEVFSSIDNIRKETPKIVKEFEVNDPNKISFS
jgi:hypothetical protein